MGTRKLCHGHEILCRGNEILSRGNEIIMSWERDHMSWERDNYVVGTREIFFSHVPSVLPYKINLIKRLV